MLSWGLFNLQQAAQRTVTVSVNFSGLADWLELIGPPESIDLQVRGNQTLIDGLSPEGLTASVDLSGAERGGRFAIEPGDVSVDLPAGLVWSLDDPSLSVALDERVVVAVPVRSPARGPSTAGLRAGTSLRRAV